MLQILRAVMCCKRAYQSPCFSLMDLADAGARIAPRTVRCSTFLWMNRSSSWGMSGQRVNSLTRARSSVASNLDHSIMVD